MIQWKSIAEEQPPFQPSQAHIHSFRRKTLHSPTIHYAKTPYQ